MSNERTFLVFLAGLLPIMAAVALVLTFLGGPSEDGLRCTRSTSEAQCQVRRTRFLGLFGNSTFTVPEADIRGAKSVCASAHVGGRGSANCVVDLITNYGANGDILVLSYTATGQADAAAKQLNDYLGNSIATSVEIKEDVLTPVLIIGLAPIVLVVFIVALRLWRRRRY